MGKRYSLRAFEQVRELLIRVMGAEAEEFYLEMIRLFGEGRRLKVPRVKEMPWGDYYFWNPHKCHQSVMAFKRLLEMLRQKFEDHRDADEMFRQVVVELGQGQRLTVPSIRSVLILRRNEAIRRQFRGFNHKELAILYGLSERQVRRIVNER